MSKLTAVPVGVLTVASFLGLARQACPEAIETLQEELRGLPAALDHIKAEEQRDSELEWRLRIIAGRMAGRRRIVQAYLDGSMSLAYAAARFDALNHSPSFWPSSDNPEGVAHTTQQQLYHQVATWIIRELKDSEPQRVPFVAAQLQAELQGLGQSAAMSAAR
jgi:hypothetical protein